MSEPTTLQKLQMILHRLAAEAAAGACYDSWSDEFAREQVREVWSNTGSFARRNDWSFTPDDLRQLSDDELWSLGFGNWDGKLVLIPLWLWNYVPADTELTSIMGNVATREKADTDTRGGVTAYGFFR